MLRIIGLLFLVVAMFFTITGCAPVSDDTDNGDFATNPSGTASGTTPRNNDIQNLADIGREDWSALYYRVDYPYIDDLFTIHSVDQLSDFYNTFGFRPNPRVEEDLFLFDFTERFLILAMVSEPSGSHRHRVSSVTHTEGVLHIVIERHWAGGTDDMAGWVIAIDLSNDYACCEVDIVWEIVTYDDGSDRLLSSISAPVEDLLYIEFYGNRSDDGTYEKINGVMFVFDGVHDIFHIEALLHRGKLLTFDDLMILEHNYSLIGEAGAHKRLLFDGKTGFVVFIGEEITKPGMYVISFDYLGEMMETELAIVIGPVN